MTDNVSAEKICTKCVTPLPLSAYRVVRRKSGSVSVRNDCLRCERQYRVDTHDRRLGVARSWHAEHAERSALAKKAQRLTAKALRRGSLVRAAACEECGDPQVEPAHADYRFDLLWVRWLCRSCHRSWDRLEPKSLLESLGGRRTVFTSAAVSR